MIIECGKVIIDTSLDHKAHKEEIKKKTHFFCERNRPEQWFTQEVNGYKRFYQLHYNDDGSKLQKITSWDRKKEEEMKKTLVKKPKYDKDDCYFSLRDKTKEFEWVEEIDYLDISKNRMTHWEKGWKEDPNKQITTKEESNEQIVTKKKKRWKFFG